MKIFNFVNKNVQYFTISNLIFLSLLFQLNCDETKTLNAVVIPVKTYYPKDYKEEDEIKGLISTFNLRKIYLDIAVKSGQKMATFLNSEQGQMHTSNQIAYFKDDKDRYIDQYTKNCEQICTYNYLTSNSYKKISEFDISFYYTNACKASEEMYFYKDLETKNKITYTLNYLHVTNDTHACLLVGNFDSSSLADQPYSFFYQIKNLINSQKFTWSIYFDNNKDEGKYIIGDIIDNEKISIYNDNLKENYIQIPQENYIYKLYWKIKVKAIYIGNYANEVDKEFYLNINNRYIAVSKELFNDIKNQYMIDTSDNGICKEVLINYNYFTVYCNKKKYLELTNNYQKLNNLTFFLDKVRENITFTPQDLFLEKDNYMHFFVRIDNYFAGNQYAIGTILLEKYFTVFDDDAKMLYILRPRETPFTTPKDNTTLKIVLICVFSFILCAIVFVVLGLLYGKKLFGSRKVKANELVDDNFDYTPGSINNEQNNNDRLIAESDENGGNNGA